MQWMELVICGLNHNARIKRRATEFNEPSLKSSSGYQTVSPETYVN